MAYFPLFIDLEQKNILVVGGGETAFRKVKQLLEFGCNVDVVSPDFTLKFTEIFQTHLTLARIHLHREPFREDMIKPFHALVIGATDDRAVNQAISQKAQSMGIPVNIVDDKELCTFFFPSICKDEDVVVGISSGGKNPVVSQYLREQIQDQMPKGLGTANEKLEALRAEAMETLPYEKRRDYLRKQLERLLEGAMDED